VLGNGYSSPNIQSAAPAAAASGESSSRAAAARGGGAPRAVIKVANAPCSWGALEFDWAGPAPAFAQVLDEIAATGYVGTELGDWGFLPTEPAALRDELARRRLALIGAFVPVLLSHAEDHAGGVASALRVARLLAAAGDRPFIVLSDDTARDPERTRLAGRIRPEHGLSDDAWTTVARGADLIAARVRDDSGLRTVFHHHCATYVETAAEIDEVMRRTDPALVGLCLDTGHASFGGGDPVVTLDTWRDRVWHVHLKDCDPEIASRAAREEWDYQESVRQGVFCELGRGRVDFPSVLRRLHASNYDGWLVVEQDVLSSMGTPAESAARNRAYLKSLGL
jgi:inosose dehydratase